jgi:ABC-2 type transport system permease protein
LSLCVIEIGLLLATGHFIFGVRLQNAVSLALAIASTSAGFVGIMMLLSVLGKTEQAVAGAGWGILIVMAMFGGGMVPLMMMPGWMQRISHLSPVKWGILALEGAIWRGFTLGEMFIPCAILLAVGVICFGAGVAILSRSEA